MVQSVRVGLNGTECEGIGLNGTECEGRTKRYRV